MLCYYVDSKGKGEINPEKSFSKMKSGISTLDKESYLPFKELP